MRKPRVVPVHIDFLAEPEYGTCPRCGNESLLSCPAALVINGEPVSVAPYERCNAGCDDDIIALGGGDPT